MIAMTTSSSISVKARRVSGERGTGMVLSGAGTDWPRGKAWSSSRRTRSSRPARMLEAEASPGAPERPYSGSRVGRSRTPSREPWLAVALLSGDLLAYSGGPAPDSHRLPARHSCRAPFGCGGSVYGPGVADVKDPALDIRRTPSASVGPTIGIEFIMSMYCVTPGRQPRFRDRAGSRDAGNSPDDRLAHPPTGAISLVRPTRPGTPAIAPVDGQSAAPCYHPRPGEAARAIRVAEAIEAGIGSTSTTRPLA